VTATPARADDRDDHDAAAPLPAVVVGGYLGAGKTTLVNHLLREAGGARIAVLVNDFGDVAIDAELIVGAYRDVLALAGGCICCSTGGDLVGALRRLLALRPRPQRVLIECSGVALPIAVARTASLVPDIAVEAIVVLVDAADVRARAADAYVGDTVQRQIEAADVLLLNRCDAVPEAQRHQVAAWLASLAPRVPVLPVTHAAVDPALLLGWRGDAGSSAADSPPQPRPLRPASARFTTRTRIVDHPVDPAALAASMATGDDGVVRAKGIVRGLDGRCWLIQTVGRRAECTPWSGGTDQLGRVLLISTREPSRAAYPTA
jgi:G3E family GTPase